MKKWFRGKYFLICLTKQIESYMFRVYLSNLFAVSANIFNEQVHSTGQGTRYLSTHVYVNGYMQTKLRNYNSFTIFIYIYIYIYIKEPAIKVLLLDILNDIESLTNIRNGKILSIKNLKNKTYTTLFQNTYYHIFSLNPFKWYRRPIKIKLFTTQFLLQPLHHLDLKLK